MLLFLSQEGPLLVRARRALNPFGSDGISYVRQLTPALRKSTSSCCFTTMPQEVDSGVIGLVRSLISLCAGTSTARPARGYEKDLHPQCQCLRTPLDYSICFVFGVGCSRDRFCQCPGKVLRRFVCFSVALFFEALTAATRAQWRSLEPRFSLGGVQLFFCFGAQAFDAQF